MKKTCAATILLFTVLSVYPVFAGSIRLDTAVACGYENEKLKISITHTNTGDEPAYNLQGEIEAYDTHRPIPAKDKLSVGETYSIESFLDLDREKPGSYPLTVTTSYRDANNHPFSSVVCSTYTYRKEPLPHIFGQIKPVTFSKRGKLRMTLKNLDEIGLTTSTRLVVPREITAEREALECIVPPRGEASLHFDVDNFGALAGSTYPVFCITEFERGEMHHTAISQGSISISEWDFFEEYRTHLVALIIILLVVFISLQFVKRDSKT